MEQESDPDYTILYDGPEGTVGFGGPDEEITFLLDLGEGLVGQTIRSDGTVISYEGGEEWCGTSQILWSDMKVWTAEEAAPLKAFLRAKGITLPHVQG